MFQQDDELITQSKWANVRDTRSLLLKEADKLVNIANDSGVDIALYRQYRQALRDIPQTYSNPDDVVWPEKPAV